MSTCMSPSVYVCVCVCVCVCNCMHWCMFNVSMMHNIAEHNIIYMVYVYAHYFNLYNLDAASLVWWWGRSEFTGGSRGEGDEGGVCQERELGQGIPHRRLMGSIWVSEQMIHIPMHSSIGVSEWGSGLVSLKNCRR